MPFDHLTWENFEKLCLRLVKLEADVEDCRLYGVRGQNQEGIDIYANLKRTGSYRTYQCKREDRFGPAKISGAVARFLAGEWANKSDTLVLCVKTSLTPRRNADELEKQRSVLKSREISLIPWDSQSLSTKLKALPEVVDDFFGREWVKAFCGEEAAKSLGTRLDVNEVTEFRRRYAEFYRRVFQKHDPGLPMISAVIAGDNLPLEERYIIPDIETHESLTVYPSEINIPDSEYTHTPASNTERDLFQWELKAARQPVQSRTIVRTDFQRRQELENWLTASDRSVILGGPGSGKSATLRFITLDLLRDSPQLNSLTQKWGRHLPVWVPFAYWTKIVAASTTVVPSLSQVMRV